MPLRVEYRDNGVCTGVEADFHRNKAKEEKRDARASAAMRDRESERPRGSYK